MGVGSSETKNADKSSQESEAGYYEVLLRGGGNEVLFEAAASSPRTSTMRLTYQNDAATGFVRLPGSVTLSEREVHWVVTYNTSEEGILLAERHQRRFRPFREHAYRSASGGYRNQEWKRYPVLN